jgi:hypothetical protein
VPEHLYLAVLLWRYKKQGFEQMLALCCATTAALLAMLVFIG